jgi:hypothetical protein
LVAEAILGRLLVDPETLHHINEIRDDNRGENLYLFPSRAEHSRYHRNIENDNCDPITMSNL